MIEQKQQQQTMPASSYVGDDGSGFRLRPKTNTRDDDGGHDERQQLSTNSSSSSSSRDDNAAIPSSSCLRAAALLDPDEAGKLCVRQGYAFPVQVVTEREAATLLERLEEYESTVFSAASHARATTSSNNQKALSGDDRFDIHLLLPWAWRLVHHPALVELARASLRTEDVWCWSTDLNIKEPKSDALYTWHQDSTYAGNDPPDGAVTVWLASTPSTAESGCVKCIPNSHLSGQIPHDEGRGGTNNVLAMQQQVRHFPPGLGPDQSEAIVLRPGQASVHSFLAIHSSEPNTSANRRIGLAIRYVSARCTRPNSKAKETATLVSGVGNDLFDPEPEPRVAMGDRERAAHRVALERQKQNYFSASSSPSQEGGGDGGVGGRGGCYR